MLAGPCRNLTGRHMCLLLEASAVSCSRPGTSSWRKLRASRPRAATCKAASQAGDELALVEWDVVLYQIPNSCTAVGRVSELRPQSVIIERLEEEGEGLWAVTEEVDRVPPGAVRAVLAADYLQLCDADRVSNPHGEHAHEAFRILEGVPLGAWGSRSREQ